MQLPKVDLMCCVFRNVHCLRSLYTLLALSPFSRPPRFLPYWLKVSSASQTRLRWESTRSRRRDTGDQVYLLA